MSGPQDTEVAVVTGANRGIGLATARGLAEAGWHVVMLGRDRASTERAARRIDAAVGRAATHVIVADLASQRSIHDAAAAFTDSYERLDALVNNAAIAPRRRRLSTDGIELQFAVNHLAPFLLTHLLLDHLTRSAPSRIVNVSSGAHYDAALDADDPWTGGRYAPFAFYRRTKLANVLFTRELAHRLRGTGVTVNCLHPGVVATGLVTGFFGVSHRLAILFRPWLRSTTRGADTSVYLCTAPELENVTGQYIDDREVTEPSARACDEQLGRDLWTHSIELTGITNGP